MAVATAGFARFRRQVMRSVGLKELQEVPTILRIGPYRFFFYSNENNEPAHIHVQREGALAKFWLTPVSLASSTGFPAQELTKLSRLVQENATTLVEAWNEFFSTQK